MAPAAALAWLAAPGRLPRTFRGLDPGIRLPWYGPAMSAASSVTARLMETWAHGQDIADALGVTRPPTARLRHVAHLGVGTLDFGFMLPPAGPAAPVRVELTAPDGETGPGGRTAPPTGSRARRWTSACGHPAPAPGGHRAAVAGPVAAAWLAVAQAFAGPPGPGRPPGCGWPVAALSRPVRIANCSGFYGDRLDAAREMVEGGPVDVLTGDYLAELTMLILWKARQKDPAAGYARTFLPQFEEVLGTCLDRGIRVVTNAGGLNPAGLAARSASWPPGSAWPRGRRGRRRRPAGRIDGLLAAGHRWPTSTPASRWPTRRPSR